MFSFCWTFLSGQISLTGSPYSQDFNTLASSGSTSSTVPAGWLFAEAGTNANATYGIDNGGLNSGNTYSYGTTSSTDRALGGLRSGSLISTIGGSFINNLGSTISELTINYTGEQWRLGATGRADRLDFQYSLDATSLSTGTWIDVDLLDFSSPTTTGTVGAKDGNNASFRTAISYTITGLSIADGATFFIRWNDFDATGADDGLAIDDFSISANATPSCTPPTLQATLFSGSNATTNSMDISWTRGNGDNVLVVARAGGAVDADPASGTSYTADATFGSGDEIGTGNYVVYNGSGNGVSLTGLNSGTTYHFAIYEYFTADDCYYADELTGNYATLSSGSEIQLEYPVGTEVACGATMSFGSVNNGSNSDLVFRIKNTGTDDLNISNLPLVISGTNADQFSIQVQPVSPVPGSSFTDVTVRFAPTSAGAKSAVINILSDDSDEPSCSVNLSGTGVLVPLHYRTAGSGSWTSAANWEQSTDGMTWTPASASPVAGDNTITIRTGYAITSGASLSVDQLTIETGGTLEITGGTFTVADGSGTDLAVNGTWTLTNGTITVSGTVEVNNGGVFNYNKVASGTIILPLCTWNTGSTLLVSATGTSTSFNNTANQSFYNITWNNSNQSNAVNFSGNLHTINGDLRILATGAGSEALRLTGSVTSTLTVSGNLEVASGTTLALGNGDGISTLILHGDATISGTLDLGADNNASIFGYGIAEFKGDVDVPGQIFESGQGVGNTIKFNGTTLQTLSAGLPITGLIHMEIDNPAGVQISSGIEFEGNVNFTNGVIFTNSFTFTTYGSVAHTSSSFFCTSDASGNYYNSGGLGRIVDVGTNPDVFYAVGPTPSLFMPATLHANAGTDYDLYVARVNPLGTDMVDPADDTKCIQYQWEIENSGTNADINLELQWAAGTEGANFNAASGLFIGHWDGTKFDVVHAATYDALEPSATSNTGFTGFSPFVISSESTALPVKWLDIQAVKNNTAVLVSWRTASEENNKLFEVERMESKGGFIKIGQVLPAAATAVVHSYSFADKNPAPGINYYRIKQIDWNGQASYSPLAQISFGSKELSIVNINQQSVLFKGINSTALMQVRDINGKIVKQRMVSDGETELFENLTSGMYIITLTQNDQAVSVKFILGK